MKIFLWILIFLRVTFAMDFTGEFSREMDGRLSLMGLPSYNGTPARLSLPSFGISYVMESPFKSEGPKVKGFGASGEWGEDFYRISFGSSYLQMDSIYRQVYSEVSTSFNNSFFIVGGAYGFSAEWSPGISNWGRHRYKIGSSFLWKGIALGGMVSNGVDAPLKNMNYVLGIQGNSKGGFHGYVEYDGKSLDVGNRVDFKYISLASAYRFPDFGVAISLTITIKNWDIGGNYGFMGEIFDWFGCFVSKKISKKTIL